MDGNNNAADNTTDINNNVNEAGYNSEATASDNDNNARRRGRNYIANVYTLLVAGFTALVASLLCID